MAVVIKENFMENEYCDMLYGVLSGHDFPWYVKTHMVHDDVPSTTPFLSHGIFADFKINSHYWDLFLPLIEAVGPRSLLKVRVNNFPQWNAVVEHGWHTDFPYHDSKTAIYYVNSNNGATLVENHGSIASVANSLAILDGSAKHTSTSHTDTQYRFTIVINYF